MALIFEQEITDSHSVCVIHDKGSVSYVYLFPTASRGTSIASKTISRGSNLPIYSEMIDWVRWGIDNILPKQYNYHKERI